MRLAILFFSCLGLCAGAAADGLRTDAIRNKLENPKGGVFVIAHRGCHNASPRKALPAVPENSLRALEQCVQLGVDMMELDLRRTRDGALAVIHDDTIDRTTDGQGKVADFTLAQLQRHRLRQNMGGRMSPMLTDQRIPTLADMLAAARGRIMLNLDIKDDIYPAVMGEVRAAGMERQVLVKTPVTNVEPAVSGQPLFAGIPYMPIIGHGIGAALTATPANIATKQLAVVEKPVGVEMVFLSPEEALALQKVVDMAGIRSWANTLTSVGVVSITGQGGDLEALRTSGSTWGQLLRSGVSMIQTDEPGPLLDYLDLEGALY